jgi:hypothetical protein
VGVSGEVLTVDEKWKAFGGLLAFVAIVYHELQLLSAELDAAGKPAAFMDVAALSHAIESAYTRIRFIGRQCGHAAPTVDPCDVVLYPPKQ